MIVPFGNRNRATAQGTVCAAILAACVVLGGCSQLGELTGSSGLLHTASTTATGSVPGQTGLRPTDELEKATEYWGKEVGRDPRNGKAVLAYARNLKALGRKQEALSVLQSSYTYNAANREYLSEYGRLALDLGQVSTAGQLLERADDPAQPDWRVSSARGTVLARQGQYKEALSFFERARDLSPGQASVLNNLAMAYTMDGQAERGEQLLREASLLRANDPRIKQNLALVLNLQGKKDNADAAPNSDASLSEGPSRIGSSFPGSPVDTVTGSRSLSTPNAVASLQPVTAHPWRETFKLAETAVEPRTTGALPDLQALDPDQIITAAIESEMMKAKPDVMGGPGRPARRSTLQPAPPVSQILE